MTWAEDLIEAARPLFPRSLMIGTYGIDYSPDLQRIHMNTVLPKSLGGAYDALETAANEKGAGGWAPFHFSGPAVTQSELVGNLGPSVEAEVNDLHGKVGSRDGVALIGHPTPGRIFVMLALADAR